MKAKVIEWMEEAGKSHTGQVPADEAGIIGMFEFVAKKSAEFEREACAKLASELYSSARADEIAAAIRARGDA